MAFADVHGSGCAVDAVRAALDEVLTRGDKATVIFVGDEVAHCTHVSPTVKVCLSA